MNDPIGAMLSVLVFGTILAGGLREATALAVMVLLKTVLFGGLIGVSGAILMVLLLKRYWIPDFLQNGVTLMVVAGVFVVANLLQMESGLLAVTVMGMVMANQKSVTVKHIIEFKENLRVLLISSLFILLAARLQPSDLTHINLASLIFLGVLILIVRPASVVLSTLRSELSWRERLFLSWLAPRGIVAAAVASIFSLRLVEAGYPQAERLAPLAFLVIVGTVAIYGLTAFPVARWLRISQPNPQGMLIVGAHSWARDIAVALEKEGYQVLLVDTDRANISDARRAGLSTFYASILSEYVLNEIELGGIGRLMALTSNDEVNSLAALHFADIFGRAEVYQLPPEIEASKYNEPISLHLSGRLLFAPKATYTYLNDQFNTGAIIQTIHLTDVFDDDDFQALYGATAIPLFLIDEAGDLLVFATDNPPTLQPGQTLISLVKARAKDTCGAR